MTAMLAKQSLSISNALNAKTYLKQYHAQGNIVLNAPHVA